MACLNMELETLAYNYLLYHNNTPISEKELKNIIFRISNYTGRYIFCTDYNIYSLVEKYPNIFTTKKHKILLLKEAYKNKIYYKYFNFGYSKDILNLIQEVNLERG
ncbi:Uncharacterised protein [Chlamydia trachomatis]|nr:Uncharacterised protein [Chlamydia trachomatis]